VNQEKVKSRLTGACLAGSHCAPAAGTSCAHCWDPYLVRGVSGLRLLCKVNGQIRPEMGTKLGALSNESLFEACLLLVSELVKGQSTSQDLIIA
jgi:hypothetical protein